MLAAPLARRAKDPKCVVRNVEVCERCGILQPSCQIFEDGGADFVPPWESRGAERDQRGRGEGEERERRGEGEERRGRGEDVGRNETLDNTCHRAVIIPYKLQVKSSGSLIIAPFT